MVSKQLSLHFESRNLMNKDDDDYNDDDDNNNKTNSDNNEDNEWSDKPLFSDTHNTLKRKIINFIASFQIT